MGFFSWKTSDTDRSIANSYSERETFSVTVLCPDGTKIREDNYMGYGVFGGRDIYQLVAEWNAPERCNGDVDHDRGIGIDISDLNNDGNARLKYPIKIIESARCSQDTNYDSFRASEHCPEQGFFYDDEANCGLV